MFTKADIRKLHELDEDTGDLLEAIDLRLQYQLGRNDTMEDARTCMIQMCDQKITRLFQQSARSLKRQAEEAERWSQMGMFGPPL